MKAFFDDVREDFGPLTQNQVDGLSLLVNATKGLPLAHRAYILATAWHETGPEDSALHMTPRREIWGPTAAQKGYEGRADLGNTVLGDGKRFMGRGYVQITGRTNYNKASSLTGRDLIGNPDLALEPEIASLIIVDGMTKGWFTGKKLSDFATFRDMRRVVNGTDKADLIASYAFKFEDALKSLNDAPDALVPDVPATSSQKGTSYMSTIAKAIAAFLTSLVALLAAFGIATDWATPGLIEAVAAVIGAFLTGFMTWLIPNKQ